MGKITGFLEIEREDRDYAPVAERTRHFREFVLPPVGGGDPQAGRALHGLRHSLLPSRLSGEQPDSRLERSRLSRRVAGSRAQSLFNQQLPGSHGPGLPSAVRGVLHAQHRGCAGHDQKHRMRDCGPLLRRRLGRSRSRPRGKRASASPSWALVRRVLPRRSSSRARGTRSMSTRRMRCPAGCLRYGIPDFKLEKHIIERRVAQMQAEGVTFHCNVHVGVTRFGCRS